MADATAVFSIDGYEISATFAEAKNTEAIGQVKQILLSAFAACVPSRRPGAILVKSPETRDNHDRG